MRARYLLRRLGGVAHRALTPITPGAKRAVVILFALSLALNGANLLWTAHEVSSAAAAQRREEAARQQATRHQAAVVAAAQRREGAIIEQKLCTTLGKLAALRPPPGSAPANPSRAYEQALHTALAQLGPDIGCKGAGR